MHIHTHAHCYCTGKIKREQSNKHEGKKERKKLDSRQTQKVITLAFVGAVEVAVAFVCVRVIYFLLSVYTAHPSSHKTGIGKINR